MYSPKKYGKSGPDLSLRGVFWVQHYSDKWFVGCVVLTRATQTGSLASSVNARVSTVPTTYQFPRVLLLLRVAFFTPNTDMW